MTGLRVRRGIALVEVFGICLLVADEEARKECPYLRQLNEIGAFIWRQLEEGKEADEIEFLLRDFYDVPESYDLEADLKGFMTSLHKDHYILLEGENNEV